MKFIQIFALLLISMGFSGCFRSTYHGAKIDQTSIKIGDSEENIIQTIGQESLPSNDGKSIYYIFSNAKQFYFLRPRNIQYQIIKVTFNNHKVSNVETIEHNTKYYGQLFKKLKNQDKIKAEDFFKEIVGASSVKPSS